MFHEAEDKHYGITSENEDFNNKIKDKNLMKSKCLTRLNTSKLESTVVMDECISYYDGFLSSRDCTTILEELDTAFWKPSLTYTWQHNAYKNILTPFRVSDTAHQVWFGSRLNSILSLIDRRLNALFGVKQDHLEPWQATRYPKNGKFDYHLDAGFWTDHPAGERILTFLIYLTTPRNGGGTHFRALDLHVEGREGRLVVWNNLFPNGECNYRMIHSSTPLEFGEKVTLVTWQRQQKYRGVTAI